MRSNHIPTDPVVDLYRTSVVVDACAAVAPFSHVEGVRPEEYLQAYGKSGVTLIVFSVVDDVPVSIEQTVKLLGRNRRFILERPETCMLADRVETVRLAKASGKLAVAFAFQGSNALLGDLALVETYRRLGVVQMILAYNTASFAADGCHESRNAGLSKFGRDLIAELNRTGIIVDVTHVGVRSSLEALELTTKPPLFSHSTPKRFAPHDRNITDEQIRACASRDGLICLSGVGLFMDGIARRASVSKLADTIDYVVQLVGPRHAGIGLDYMDSEVMARFFRANPTLYGRGGQYPANGHIEMLPPASFPELTEELSRRGHSDGELRAILGENYLRVLEANVSRPCGAQQDRRTIVS